MRLAPALVLAGLIVASPVQACDVRLRAPVPNCPAVTYSLDDCDSTKTGKAGDKITNSATINMMSSGHAYYCPSHEGCVPLEQVLINQCVLTYIPRQNGESPEYLAHIVVDTKVLKHP